MGTRREDLDARWPEHAPFDPAEAVPPFELWTGRGASALVASAGRLRAWRDGWIRAEGSPLRPEVLAELEDAILIAACGAPVDPRAALRALPGRVERVEGTRRAILAALEPEARRALSRLGLPRGAVDRWANGVVAFDVEVIAPAMGGVAPPFWRASADRVVALRMDRVRPTGWRVTELAALGDDGEGEAFALARAALALGEAVRAGDPGLARDELAPRVLAGPEPAAVRVWIDGPPAIEGLWELPGASVSPRRARWLLAHLDGLRVAGGTIRVRVEPPIPAGRRARRREPRAVRQRRLFERWGEGIRVDDEGLVGLTPERLALAIAARAHGVAIDGTSGVGGIAIALARTPAVSRVIAVDRSAERLAMARHNAAIYGVADRIEWVEGDVLEVLASRRADVLVLDPPWGGRGYDRARVALADLGLDVAAALARFDGEVLLKLPRSFDPSTLPHGEFRVELMLDEREQPKLLLVSRAAR